ncbi:hypothetical protein KC19_10G160800 [Ceratodon purpureus]|uniref:Protein EFFECTOR OF TRANSCRIPTION 2-like n=1 Tax=Ceratodon purpureus TaxID=3225 RepID=A0A8T0GME9_CERPU|nr:hypothetical protein KC19_10G160800 [Ceratodon purpureus]
MASRLRREDYDKVKHDKCFSDWKVLVGPPDWQASGREGGEQFRSRNLPGPQVGSGVYELGVTLPAWKTVDHYSESASLKSEDIVVVYVGHAEHMRKRLQRYGQAGAHLEGPRSPISPPGIRFPELNFSRFEDLSQSSNGEEHLCKYSQTTSDERPSRIGGRRGSRVDMRVSIPQNRIPVADPLSPGVRGRGSPRGPRLFSEVFALGCSVAYRWASTSNKEVAEYVVHDLTEVFDYAWNRGGNSHMRLQDILGKIVLGKRAPDTSCCTRTTSRWRGFLFMRKPVVGIRIAAHKPARTRVRRRLGQSEDSGPRRFFMMLRKSPHLMIINGKSAKQSEFTKINIPVDRCGVLLESGLVCNGLPQKGHQRCPMHMHVDLKKTSRRKSSQVTSQDSRSGSLASDPQEPVSFDSQKGLSLPKVPISCFPFRHRKKPKQKEQKRKGSISFSTWLTRSVEIKNKSIEWLLALEEMKGRSYNNNCSTSPILKPEIFSPENLNPSEEFPPGWLLRISPSNLNQGMESVSEQEVPEQVEDLRHYPKVDSGMPYSIVSKGSPVRWPRALNPSDYTYAARYTAPQYFQG